MGDDCNAGHTWPVQTCRGKDTSRAHVHCFPLNMSTQYVPEKARSIAVADCAPAKGARYKRAGGMPKLKPADEKSRR